MIAASGSGAASVITAIGACIAACAGGAAAVIVALNRRTATTTEKKVDEVHTLTNNALTEATGRQTVAENQNVQLTQALKDAQEKAK